MQKIIYYCDKCKKEIKTGRVRVEFIDVGTDATTRAFDLHPECRNEILALFDDAEEPKKRIDHGKAMALHDAGWKNKDIAGEMALKESQVSQVIYQEKKRREKE